MHIKSTTSAAPNSLREGGYNCISRPSAGSRAKAVERLSECAYWEFRVQTASLYD